MIHFPKAEPPQKLLGIECVGSQSASFKPGVSAGLKIEQRASYEAFGGEAVDLAASFNLPRRAPWAGGDQ